MILLLDNFDSFTYNLVDYFLQAGVTCQVVRNDVALEEIKKLSFTAIVLSPGPGRPADSGNMLEIIHSYHKKMPILGICLGHQALGEFYGAHLVKADKPMHGKICTVYVAKDIIFEKIPPTFNVVRYHSLVLKNVPYVLQVLARTASGEVMIIKHKHYNSYGIQFHPEAYLTEYGLQLLKNWIKTINII